MNTFILAFVSGAIFLLGVALYFIAKGRKEERADSALNHVDDLNKVLKQRRKDEKDIANMSIDDKLDEL